MTYAFNFQKNVTNRHRRQNLSMYATSQAKRNFSAVVRKHKGRV